jgi:hypothetical protein
MPHVRDGSDNATLGDWIIDHWEYNGTGCY